MFVASGECHVQDGENAFDVTGTGDGSGAVLNFRFQDPPPGKSHDELAFAMGGLVDGNTYEGELVLGGTGLSISGTFSVARCDGS